MAYDCFYRMSDSLFLILNLLFNSIERGQKWISSLSEISKDFCLSMDQITKGKKQKKCGTRMVDEEAERIGLV